MFYMQLEQLCAKNNISISTFVVDKLHMSKGNIAGWRKGQVPSANTIKKIADYFGVTTDYLLTGKKQENVRVYDKEDNIVVLDDETRDLIDSLRKRPEMKILFSVSKKAAKEDIIQAVKIIEALKDNKEGD